GRGRGGMYTVRVVGEDGKPAPKQVKIGVNNNVSAEVLDGLKEGDKVVVAQGTGQKSGASNRNQQQRNPLAPGGPGQGRRAGGAGGFGGPGSGGGRGPGGG